MGTAFQVKKFTVLNRYEIHFGKEAQGFFYEIEDLVHNPTKAPGESNPKRPGNPIENARLEGVRRGFVVV